MNLDRVSLIYYIELFIVCGLMEKTSVTIDESSSWFTHAFGFEESSNYHETQKKFIEMYRQGQNQTINGINVGQFALINRSQLPIFEGSDYPGNQSPTVTLSHRIGDVVQLHLDPVNQNATFQIASQQNCLEMINPQVSPEDGITIYSKDLTQGPISAMLTPAGLAYREFLIPIGSTQGQSATKQLDMSYPARQQIARKSGVFGKTINGYLFYTNEELHDLNQALFGVTSERIISRQCIRQLVAVGFHHDLGINHAGITQPYRVSHVYCSGLPINYQSNPDRIAWKGISELFLEAIYENTLLMACLNNTDTGRNQPCYLTLVGGGVFGMNVDQIYRAIERACILIARNGFTLNVVLVHHQAYHPELLKFGLKPKVYAGNEQYDPSIWDVDPIKWTEYRIQGSQHYPKLETQQPHASPKIIYHGVSSVSSVPSTSSASTTTIMPPTPPSAKPVRHVPFTKVVTPVPPVPSTPSFSSTKSVRPVLSIKSVRSVLPSTPVPPVSSSGSISKTESCIAIMKGDKRCTHPAKYGSYCGIHKKK